MWQSMGTITSIRWQWAILGILILAVVPAKGADPSARSGGAVLERSTDWQGSGLVEGEKALRLEIGDPDVQSLRLEVFDGKGGDALWDTGLVAGNRLLLESEAVEVLRTSPGLRYELRAWNGAGELVLSQVSNVPRRGEQIFSIGFEVIPAGTSFRGDPITFQANVDVIGSLEAATLQAGELTGAGGGAFFGICTAGSSIRSIAANGSVICEPTTGTGDNLGDHRATETIQFQNPQQGITAPGGAKLLTGPLGGTWFPQAGSSGRHRFGVRSFDAPPGDLDADFAIDADGNVGIFTFTPAAPLDVRGNARIGSGGDWVELGSDASNARLEFRALDGSSTPYIDFSNDNSPGTDFDMRLFLSGDNSLTLDGGRLGVGGMMTNPQFKIDLPNIGNADGRIRANDFCTYASKRNKKHIQTVPNALEKLRLLRGVEFNWSAEQGGARGLGFVAEEVGQVLPELVDWEENGVDAKALSYNGLIPVLVEALKEQQSLFEAQQERLIRLEEQLCAAQPTMDFCR